MLARAVLLGIAAGAHEASPVLISNVSACSRVATGGPVAWKASARGISSSVSMASSPSTGGRWRLLDGLFSSRSAANDQKSRTQSHQHKHRSASLAALIACGTVAATAVAFSAVSSAKEKRASSVEKELKTSSSLPSSPVSSSPTLTGCPASSSPCAQPGAAPASAPVDRAALLSDLRAWLEAAGADVSAIDIRPCEGNSAGIGVFATSERRRGGGYGGDRGGALETARAVASALARRVLPFGGGGGGGGGASDNSNLNSADSTSTSSPTVVLASFPLSLAVTPAAALADEATGPHYARLLASPSRQLDDERALVMLFLAVERARGRSSRWAPWIAALPRDFSTPLHFTEEQLSLLDGTTLGKAAASLRARLAAAWGRLSPAAAEVAAAAGVAAPPTLEDFKWAYSTFWSRGMAVPWPVVVATEAEAAGAVGAAGAAGAGAGAPLAVAVEVVECILPGLDFCNHAPGAAVRWTLWGAGGAGGEEEEEESRKGKEEGAARAAAPPAPDRVALVAPAASAPRPGDELLIDYGDKSQEELLLLYGFAHATNAATGGRLPGVLMVPCPLPAAPPPPPASSGINNGGSRGEGGGSRGGEGDKNSGLASSSSSSSLHPQTLKGWDPDLEDRLELLRRRGLTPQVFLPVSGPAEGNGNDGAPAPPPSRSWLPWPFSSPAPSSTPPQTPASFLPPGVWDTLEAFVLEPAVVRGALAHPDAVTPPRSGIEKKSGGKGELTSSASSAPSVEDAGLRMAVLTTLARLLEGTVLTLEGPGGTGPLEMDVEWLLEEEAAVKKTASEDGAATSSSAAPAPASSDAAIRRACVEYRATQKAAARRWLARARRAVDEQVRELEGLMASEER